MNRIASIVLACSAGLLAGCSIPTNWMSGRPEPARPLATSSDRAPQTAGAAQRPAAEQPAAVAVPAAAAAGTSAAAQAAQPDPAAPPSALPAAAGPNLTDLARARGVRFVARGQEPGWRIEIGPGDQLRVVHHYGTVRLDVPAPARVMTGGVTVYEGQAQGHRVRVELRSQDCTDSMSGERHPLTVQFQFDAEVLRGCGAPLTP